MFQFDWTITLGNVLSTVMLLLAFVGGAYRFVFNHIEHMRDQMARDVKAAKEQLAAHVDEAKTQVAHLGEAVNRRFDSMDKDIRELRDWTIVMRGQKPGRG